MNTARFLRYVWPCYNIMHERVKSQQINRKKNFFKICFDKPDHTGNIRFFPITLRDLSYLISCIVLI